MIHHSPSTASAAPPRRRATGVMIAGIISLSSLSACDVTRLALPAHPSATDEATANRNLAGQPAVVTLRTEPADQPETRAVMFDGDGHVVLAQPVDERVSESDAPPLEWKERIPVDRVREISTVNRGRGAGKGAIYGALAGFGFAMPATFIAFQQPCNGFCVFKFNTGTALLLSAVVGLIGGVAVGGIGAGIGAAIGDGTVVTVAP